MTDSVVKARVKGILGGPQPTNEPPEQPNSPSGAIAQQQAAQHQAAPHQAVQVLALAQRTADDHVASARREADKVRTDARAAAEQIVRDAQEHAHGLRQEAEKALSDAHATTERMGRDVKARIDDAQRDAEKVVSAAKAQADKMAKDAKANADELGNQAKQRYDDVVGGLAAKREELQRQIEALEQFDREYRARLTTFMQNQLRGLWVDQPQVDPEGIEESDGEAKAPPVPEQASRS